MSSSLLVMLEILSVLDALGEHPKTSVILLQQARTSPTKLVARPVFQGWQNCTGGITWYKSESVFHNLCYHDQMDNVCAGKD